MNTEIVHIQRTNLNESYVIVPFVTPVIQTQYNRASMRKRYEVNLEPSLTVPDQSMSIPEILARYAKGLPLEGNNKVPLYEGEEDPLFGVNPKTLDLSEKYDFVENKMSELKEEYDTLQSEAQDKKRLEYEAEIERRINERQKGVEDAESTNNP